MAERPEDIEVITDWIKPGGPKARERCVRLLIRHGANVNAKDFHDYTCLHYAAMWGWASSAKMLLDGGADVNAITLTGRTPLMLAVEFRNDVLAEVLAFHPKIRIDALDADGNCALHIAIEGGDDCLKIAESLLKAGADPNMMNHRRRTPLHMACGAQNQAQVTLLLDHKAQRRASAFMLLEGEIAKLAQARLHEEEREAREAAEKAEKLKAQMAMQGLDMGSTRDSNPYGKWVEYIEKRDKVIINFFFMSIFDVVVIFNFIILTLFYS